MGVLRVKVSGVWTDVMAGGNVTPAWTPLTPLLNGWVPMGRANDPPPALRKIGDIVYLRGAIKNATPVALNTASAAFVLLPGFRPAYNDNYPSVQGGSDSWGATGYIAIDADGTINVIRAAQTPTQPHVITSLRCSFSTTP